MNGGESSLQGARYKEVMRQNWATRDPAAINFAITIRDPAMMDFANATRDPEETDFADATTDPATMDFYNATVDPATRDIYKQLRRAEDLEILSRYPDLNNLYRGAELTTEIAQQIVPGNHSLSEDLPAFFYKSS